MLARVYTCAVIGLDGQVVEVEVDTGRGLPSFFLVGLPDAAVKESSERIRSAGREQRPATPRAARPAPPASPLPPPPAPPPARSGWRGVRGGGVWGFPGAGGGGAPFFLIAER